jgi:hypothetical protein
MPSWGYWSKYVDLLEQVYYTMSDIEKQEANYCDSLNWYNNELEKDSYIIGAAVFAWWWDTGKGTFDIRGADKVKDTIKGSGTTLEQAAMDAAKSVPWMAVNTDAALYKRAQALGLGFMQADEQYFQWQGETWISQPFNLGVLYCQQGHYADDEIKVIPK